MREFFDNLESAGFSNANDIPAIAVHHDKSTVKSKLSKSMPVDYSAVIDGLTNPRKKETLLNAITETPTQNWTCLGRGSPKLNVRISD